MAAGKIKLKFTPLALGLYQFAVETASAQHELQASEHVDFSEDLEFAGVSRRGKLLSAPKSKGPAQISGFPLKATAPGDGWLEVTHRDKTLVTTTKPEVCLAFPKNYAWMSPNVFVARKNLPDRYEAAPDSFSKDSYPGEDVVESEVSEALHFYSHYPNFRICSNRFNYYVVMPKGTRLSAQEWRRLERHIFTGQAAASIEETVTAEERSCMWFQGTEIAAVQAEFGISGRPVAFHDGKLGFDSFRVIDAKKAAKALPEFQRFPGKTIQVGYGSIGGMSACIEDVLRNHRVLGEMDTVCVDPKMRCVSFSSIKGILPQIEHPLRRCEWNGKIQNEVLCPANLISKFFISLREASRKYKLENVRRFTVKTGEGFHEKAAGLWVLRGDVGATAMRDHQEENKARRERKTEMENKYGQLPKGWEKLTHEEIRQYFNIRQRLASGQPIAFQDCPILPKNWQHRERLRNWLAEQRKVVACPLTKEIYIENVRTVEDLAQIPGFLDVLQDVFEEEEWLRAIILSPAVQALALTESI